MANEERICRYCGHLSLVPVIEPGSRGKSGWRCTNSECTNNGVVQHIG